MSNITLPDITPYTIADITAGSSSISGNGVFDILMKAMAAQLLNEYDSDRITQTDYATVYLGGLTQVLQQSVQFLLNKDQSALAAATALIQYEKALIDKEIAAQQLLLIQSQVLTDEAQRKLLQQKFQTEQAQTMDNPTDDVSTGWGGVTATQAALYKAQTNGFLRDAEQKAAKLMLDVLSTQISVDDSTTVENTNCTNADIGKFVKVLATGVGVTGLST